MFPQKFRTIEDAERLVTVANARRQMVATALADALAEAQGKQPGALDRVIQILTRARIQHLHFLNLTATEQAA